MAVRARSSPRLQPGEGWGIVERSADGIVPCREASDLEMLPPLWLGRLHAGALRQFETETLVVGRIAQQEDTRSSERVGSRQDGMHQSLTDALPLAVRVHPQRPEPQRRLTVDSRPAAHHMTNDVVVVFRDDRELRDDVTVRSEGRDQNGFGRGGFARSGEGGGVQGEDVVVVTWQFASQKHAYSLPDYRGRAPLKRSVLDSVSRSTEPGRTRGPPGRP